MTIDPDYKLTCDWVPEISEDVQRKHLQVVLGLEPSGGSSGWGVVRACHHCEQSVYADLIVTSEGAPERLDAYCCSCKLGMKIKGVRGWPLTFIGEG